MTTADRMDAGRNRGLTRLLVDKRYTSAARCAATPMVKMLVTRSYWIGVNSR